jgi:hypothetical protein
MIETPIGVERNHQWSDAKDRLGLTAGAALIGVLLIAMPAGAQMQTTVASTTTSTITTVLNPTPQARIIEWDLPSAADTAPGAIVVDTQGDDKAQNRMWFVTRAGSPPRVYRMDFPRSLMKGFAKWTAWDLSSNALFTGGLKKVRASRDRRFVYVRTNTSLERIDTKKCDNASQTCELVVWADRAIDDTDTSDLAVDDKNNVFSTHAVNPGSMAPVGDPAADQSFVERLVPGTNPSDPALVTLWTVGGGAGFCIPTPDEGPSGLGNPCLSGVAVNPSNQYLVYYSEPSGNNISELNLVTNHIRRWSLTQLSLLANDGTPIRQPRQLHIDRWGKVWVATGSGHLVSLDPSSNVMTPHLVPDANTADPFGIAPDDDVVGYTASSDAHNKVGMVFPKGKAFVIYPSPGTAVQIGPTKVPPMMEPSGVISGSVTPTGKTVAAEITQKADGTYIEALLNICPLGDSACTANDSMQPLGITPVKGKAQGTFFYTVGLNGTFVNAPGTYQSVPANRVGFVRFPIKEKIKHPRDDDDENDGNDGDHSWHNWHGHATAGDDDDDGVANENDRHDMNERDAQADDPKLTPASIPSGQAIDYPVTTTATSIAVIALAQAVDPLAQIGIEVYNPSGLLVATSAPTPGTALATVVLPVVGSYKVRVRNYGAAAVTQTPTLLVREPWQP